MRSFLKIFRPSALRSSLPQSSQETSQTTVSQPQSDEQNEKLTQVSAPQARVQEGYEVKTVDSLIPVDSKWKRNPPGKQVVKVKETWFVLPPGDGQYEPGWNVRAQSPNGGRPVTGHFQWFLDNFQRQDD